MNRAQNAVSSGRTTKSMRKDMANLDGEMSISPSGLN